MDHRSELDLDAVADRLRAERPRLEAQELDELARRIRSRRSTPRRESFMKSRLAITMLLVLGLVFSTAGAGLAVSGGSDSGSAAQRQYDAKSDDGEVLGEIGNVTPSDPAPQASPPAVDPPRQAEVTSTDGQLPFTGFAAGTVLILGIAFLVTGVVLRRRVRHER